MGQISKGIIKRDAEWYNPLFLFVNDSKYEIVGFTFYNPNDGTIIGDTPCGCGWFVETKSLDYMEFKEIERRTKHDYTLVHPFFQSVGKTTMGCNGIRVYIPATIGETWDDIQTFGDTGLSYKYKMTEVYMYGDYKTTIRGIGEALKDSHYQKREEIAEKTGLSDFEIRTVVKAMKELGYNVDDLI